MMNAKQLMMKAKQLMMMISALSLEYLKMPKVIDCFPITC